MATPPKIPADALKQPNHEPESPFDVISSAPKPEPAKKPQLAMPEWMGRPVLHQDHIPQLEMDAAVNEFGLKMPRQQAEDEAYKQYLYHPQRGQHVLAARHHLLGMKAAHAVGENDAAAKHSMMYNHHAKVLGKNPDELAVELGHHTESPSAPKLYKFKAHKGDAFVIQPPNQGLKMQPSGVYSSAPPPELTKAQKEKLHNLYNLATEALKKAEKKGQQCFNSGSIVGSREGARVHHCSCGKSFNVTPKLNRKHAGETVEGWSVRVPSHDEPEKAKKGEASPNKKPHDGHCHCDAYKFCHRYGGGRCVTAKP